MGNKQSRPTETISPHQRAMIDEIRMENLDAMIIVSLSKENQVKRDAYEPYDKNPGHKNFIPVEELCKEDLQEGYSDEDVLDYSQIFHNDEQQKCLDMLDSLTLARLDREIQGPCEAEYSYGGEADLHRHYNNCEKNPGHKTFIPVDKFNIKNLPQGFCDEKMLNYIRAVSDLTVRVTVKYVSERRPETFPDSNNPYPGYRVRGKRRITVGTGCVESVRVYDGSKTDTCKCKDCQNSCTPKRQFAIISIKTASHVVFDQREAEKSTCHLFFDRGSTPDTCNGVVTLTGMSCRLSDVKEDVCHMDHYTHDLDLTQRLREIFLQRCHLRHELYDVMPRLSQYDWSASFHIPCMFPLSFIVSHPHGCSKQITLGCWKNVYRSEIDEMAFSYIYTTATCPGSSGAEVCLLGSYAEDGLSTIPASHHGTCPFMADMNYCFSTPGQRCPEYLYAKSMW